MTHNFRMQHSNSSNGLYWCTGCGTEQYFGTSSWEESRVFVVLFNPVALDVFLGLLQPRSTHGLHNLSQKTLDVFETRSFSSVDCTPVTLIVGTSFQHWVLENHICSLKHLERQRMLSIFLDGLQDSWK